MVDKKTTNIKEWSEILQNYPPLSLFHQWYVLFGFDEVWWNYVARLCRITLITSTEHENHGCVMPFSSSDAGIWWDPFQLYPTGTEMGEPNFDEFMQWWCWTQGINSLRSNLHFSIKSKTNENTRVWRKKTSLNNYSKGTCKLRAFVPDFL